MATQSDITLDVLAALKLGSTGVVNQAEFIKQIEKQTAAMMKGVTIKGNEIVIDPKFKLNKKAMDGLTTELTRQIGALEKSFGQRATGDKLSGKLLAPLFGPGNAEKNVKAAELMANRINGLSDLQARKLQRYQRDVQGFLKVRNEMMSAQRDLRTLTSRDLATKEPQRFEKARALAERYRQSLTALNKTISAGGYDKAQIGKDKEGAPFIQASQQALNQSAKELRSIEKAFTQINKKAEAFAKSGLGIESQAEARRRNYQETQRAKLASGREALDKYGAKDLPREFMRTALASRKADLTRLESKRDGGELKGKELKAYGDQHRRLTSDISTLSSGLKDYRQETDLNRIAQKKAAKAATARLDSEKAAAKQATVDRRIKGYTAQRGVDVGGISDPARLRVLRDQSADALGATKGEIGKLEDIKRRTVAQKKLLQTYRSLREEITRHNLAIDKRVAGIKKETAATQKLQAELIKAAALRQQTARAARTALKAGVSGVGTDFGANSVYARRRKDMQEYVNQLNKLIKAEKGDTGRSQEQVRRLEAVRQGYVNAGDALTNYRANLKKTASASSTLRDRLGETGLLLKSFFRYALGYGALYQVIAAFRILITSVVSLNKELKSIQAIASATEEQMISVGAAIKSVATQTKFSVAEVAKAARILAQAGVAPEEINKTLKSVSQFAAGTETAIDTAADVVSTMRNFHKRYIGIYKTGMSLLL